ncbi:hypothetical protein QUB70_24935 [Microcoleus sp. A003_D6]
MAIARGKSRLLGRSENQNLSSLKLGFDGVNISAFSPPFPTPGGKIAPCGPRGLKLG